MRTILINIDNPKKSGNTWKIVYKGKKMRVSELKVSDKARITSLVEGDKAYRQKLIAMGLIPGTEFTVSRMAPLGDPIEILVRGFALSLRKNEANILQVEKI